MSSSEGHSLTPTQQAILAELQKIRSTLARINDSLVKSQNLTANPSEDPKEAGPLVKAAMRAGQDVNRVVGGLLDEEDVRAEGS